MTDGVGQLGVRRNQSPPITVVLIKPFHKHVLRSSTQNALQILFQLLFSIWHVGVLRNAVPFMDDRGRSSN